ncbi:hypothetical protein [Phytohabitans aurantiacus]|uniref:Uncharacterized protein n=1 Tax=Phytohabitans aurantiacus TaxID=3016789 RepID=A0ABQ5QZM7_9ACTN|nr:hypothetical protein [Phytohabitans aurantiacus]GLH99894.1 hypothetical protein Pa4123_51700 [Phytohabitans aurantiacus]
MSSTSTGTMRSITTAVSISTDTSRAAALRVSPQGTCARVGVITATGLEANEIVTSQIASL